MAFPQVAASTNGNTGANVTTVTLSYPASIAANDILLAFVVSDDVPTHTWPGGWTSMWDTNFVSMKWSARWMRASGSESGTFDVTLSTSQGATWIVLRISGAHTTTAPAWGTSVDEIGTTSPSPPSLNPADWDVEDTLFVAACAWENGTMTLSAYPANYTANQITDRWNNADGMGIGLATREVAAASEDPGDFTISSGQLNQANTLAIRPAPAGGGGALPVHQYAQMMAA